MIELNCKLPDDLTDYWTESNNPYRGNFNIKSLYEDMFRIIDLYPENEKLVSLSGKGHRYGCSKEESQATFDASLMHNLFSTHSELLLNWISKQSKIDAIIRTNITSKNDSFKMRGIMEDVLSLSMAGRKPLIICDAFTSHEIDNDGYGVWSFLKLPLTLLDFMTHFRVLCETERCIVLPESVSIDTCLIDIEGRTSFENMLMPSLEDIFASDRNYHLNRSQKEDRLIEIIVPRPILEKPTNYSNLPFIVDEHAENYIMYQSIISKLCTQLINAKNSIETRDAFLEFEAGISALEVEYKKLKRNMQFKGIETTFSLAATVLSIVVPDIAPIVSYVTGSATIWNGLETIRSINNIENDLRTSPYWLPWYSRHQNKKFNR